MKFSWLIYLSSLIICSIFIHQNSLSMTAKTAAQRFATIGSRGRPGRAKTLTAAEYWQAVKSRRRLPTQPLKRGRQKIYSGQEYWQAVKKSSQIPKSTFTQKALLTGATLAWAGWTAYELKKHYPEIKAELSKPYFQANLAKVNAYFEALGKQIIIESSNPRYGETLSPTEEQLLDAITIMETNPDRRWHQKAVDFLIASKDYIIFYIKAVAKVIKQGLIFIKNYGIEKWQKIARALGLMAKEQPEVLAQIVETPEFAELLRTIDDQSIIPLHDVAWQQVRKIVHQKLQNIKELYEQEKLAEAMRKGGELGYERYQESTMEREYKEVPWSAWNRPTRSEAATVEKMQKEREAIGAQLFKQDKSQNLPSEEPERFGERRLGGSSPIPFEQRILKKPPQPFQLPVETIPVKTEVVPEITPATTEEEIEGPPAQIGI